MSDKHSKSDKAWMAWGEQDPYFGVLADKRFRRESFAAVSTEFFESGTQQIAARLAAIEALLGPVTRGRALDFGCGVGRLTLPLARSFASAVGIDVSAGMLAEARSVAETQGVANVAFVLSDDALSNAVGQFDFVHTFIVLQHIGVPQGMKIIAALLDRVAPHGVISLHFSVARNTNRRGRIGYWLREHAPGYMTLVNLKAGKRWNEPMMQMNEYSLHRVITMLQERGFGPAIVTTEDHADAATATLDARRL